MPMSISEPPPAIARLSRHWVGSPMLKPWSATIDLDRPELLLASHPDHLLVEGLVAAAVGDHQLAVGLARGVDHRLAVGGVVAIGFSHSTCLPAWCARIVYSACMLFGSTT